MEAVFIIFCIIAINSILIRFMPGDLVVHIIGGDGYLRLEAEAPEAIEETWREYGLNKPLPVQYITYLNRTLHLDLRNSYRTKLPVLEMVLFCIRWTLPLIMPAIVFSSILGRRLDLRAGWKKGSLLDTATSPIMLFLNIIPTNYMAVLFLMVLAFQVGLFPINGITPGGLLGLEKAANILRHITLPLMILVILRTVSYYMPMKSTVQTIRDEEYIIVARGRGFSQEQVFRRHVLKNALRPYLTSVCIQFGHILGDSILVEVVFSWKGMDTFIYSAVNTEDFPIPQTRFLLIGICVVASNLLAGVPNMLIDLWLREEDCHA